MVSEDVARCVDDACPSACKCLRYLMQGAARWQVIADHARTPGAERCQSFKPIAREQR